MCTDAVFNLELMTIRNVILPKLQFLYNKHRHFCWVNEELRQKEKKKLPQNKPSRDESNLPRCNISFMAASAAHGCFVVTV